MLTNFISKLYHYSFYSEVHAVFQFIIFCGFSIAVPFVIPQALEAPPIFQLGAFLLLCILIVTQTRSAAQGPEAMWFDLAKKNCDSASKILDKSKSSTSISSIINKKQKQKNKKDDDDEDDDRKEGERHHLLADDTDQHQEPLNKRVFYKMSAAVTGVTIGSIGFNTCKYLAALGFRVIMVARNEEKGLEAKLKILEDDFHADLQVVVGDVSDFDGIKNHLIEDIREAAGGTWLALLVNNAGMISNDGQQTLKTNYTGPYLLTELLLPTMLRFWDSSSSSSFAASASASSSSVSKTKKWVCQKCDKVKTDIAPTNNHKHQLYSECHFCAVKTKFIGLDQKEADAKNLGDKNSFGEGLTAATLFDGEKEAEEFDTPAKREALLAQLKRQQKYVGFPRVVNVSSLFHLFATSEPDKNKVEKIISEMNKNKNNTIPKPETKIEKHLLIANSSSKKTNGSYSVSKLCSQMHAMNLALRFAKSHGLVAVSLHPGMVRSAIWSFAFGASSLKKMFSFSNLFQQMFFKSLTNGTQTSLQCCIQAVRNVQVVPDVNGVSMNGKYYADCQEVPFTIDNPACKMKELDALESWTRNQQLKEYLI